MQFRFAASGLLLATALLIECGAVAAEPVEIPAGNLLVVRTTTVERWFIASHDGQSRSVLVITVGADGSVAMTTMALPDRLSPQPDDPGNPPPTQTLDKLVQTWANEVNDPMNRVKLAAAYQATAALVEQNKITTIDQLVALQRLTNTTLLGADAAKWQGFFTKLGQWLDANTPADLAGYKARWLEISTGLLQGN